MDLLNVKSEIGRLKKVLVHRPGGELENLTPKWLDHLLFDDIPWLSLAVKEHDAFADVLRSKDVEVIYLADLVAETLDSSGEIKQKFINQFIQEANVTSETLALVIKDYLNSFKSTKAMVEQTMAGVKKIELPNFIKRTLSDYIRDYPFVMDPMPNLYFTRDPFSIIDTGIMINKMFSSNRSRETIYAEYIFKYHPVYKNPSPILYNRDNISSIEGGDVLLLNEKVIAIGVSQRTHPAAVERLAKNIFYNSNSSFEKILALDIPKSRSFMHLDTAFTQVDYGKFVVHHELANSVKIYELTRDSVNYGKLIVKPLEKKLNKVLEECLKRDITLIPCGGQDVISSDREQWSDAANTLAIAPGEVIVYERNHITNNILNQHNIKINVIPSSELSRGRGGPRCMSMPFLRESIF